MRVCIYLLEWGVSDPLYQETQYDKKKDGGADFFPGHLSPVKKTKKYNQTYR